ncbi:hypothetical protein CL656_06000 [bacterium]|nr:hypothetical protein [bacterium]|tara:strand:+ start:8212 stop:8949 length:738 start_codon:yes stop_codon:yes gene_type:complete
MPYFKKYNYLFIHIPKCGGSTIEKALGDDELSLDILNEKNHFSLKMLKSLKNKIIHRKYLSKSKVYRSISRNLAGINGYVFLQHKTLEDIIRLNYIAIEKIKTLKILTCVRNPYSRVRSVFQYWYPYFKMDIDKFIVNALTIPNQLPLLDIHRYHFLHQSYYIKNSLMLPVKICRLESLLSDIKKIDDDIIYNRIKATKPINNSKPINTCIKKSTIDLIYKYYRQDFLEFGYSKDSWKSYFLLEK